MKSEITVGLLVSGIADNYPVSVCRGAMKAAKENGVKLVIFPGKYLDRDLTEMKEIMYEYQYNTLFSYAMGKRLDAVLIIADSIGCYATSGRIRELVEQYCQIPCVLIGSKLEGYVSVNYDNYSGISEAMNYLIHDLGIRNIGMIGGPEDNTDARERKNVFKRVLAENGLPFEGRCYVEGSLSRYTKEAFNELIEKYPEMQAVFCVNDETAIGLYDVMKARRMMPGKDVMVFGFDNILSSPKMKPPLSSVWAEPSRLAENALQIALRMIAGEQVDEQVLPTKFIKRDSLGTDRKKHEHRCDRRVNRQRIDKYFDDIFYRYIKEETNNNIADIKAGYMELMHKVIDVYESGQSDIDQKNEIMRMLDGLLGNNMMDYADMENLLTHIELLYQAFRKKEGNQWRELEDTFTAVYRKAVMAVEQRLGKISADKEDDQYAMKLFVRDIMQFEKGTDQSYAVLLEHLEWFDIKNAYIYTFKKPIMHLEHERLDIPENLYLKAVLRDGAVESVLGAAQKIKTDDIFRSSMKGKDSNALVVLPLFSNEMVYGILVSDMTEKLFENGEFLVNQMGAAIKMLELLKSNAEIQRQLEESLITLKENNIELDTISKSDALTGILNRRGFQLSGEELLQRNKDLGVRTMVAYVDMNNLKIVNDRYGHDEGDFSIKLISEMLTEAVAGIGLAGRVGGDEFALAVSVSPDDEERAFVEKIYGRFQKYNEGSEKPYNITVSVGTCIVEADDALTLKEAMTLADGKLYAEKQNRVKSVAK
ncbi:MAG: GGDEF domain-containing protein [Lachnospiraceae bacterium]|nr:GGDEF domain-containing protein [Lachnospiraceae bacterium]